MSLVREALEACITDATFMQRELRDAVAADLRPIDGHEIALRLVDVEDREAVMAELRGGPDAPLVLSAFADVEDAVHAYRVERALWDAGFDELSRYRVPKPLALLEGDGLVVSERVPGIPLARLVDRRAPEAVRVAREAGAWLGRLHAAEVREGSVWLPWRSVDALSVHLRARARTMETLRETVRPLIRRLAPLAGRAAPTSWAQTHGRFRPDRVTASPGVVTVEDFVRSVPGDPARDIAEFAFHLRRRAVLGGDARADALEPAFLDGYLANAPDEHLDNVGFYAGCAALTSLVSNAPGGADLRDWIDFHEEEFDRWVLPAPIRILMPSA